MLKENGIPVLNAKAFFSGNGQFSVAFIPAKDKDPERDGWKAFEPNPKFKAEKKQWGNGWTPTPSTKKNKLI